MHFGVNHSQAEEAILACWNAVGNPLRPKSGRTPFFWSPPGAGKSDTIKRGGKRYLAGKGIELSGPVSLFRKDGGRGKLGVDDRLTADDLCLADITPSETKDGGMIVLRCSVLEPPDVAGLLYPDVENRVTRLLPPEYLPQEGAWVIFFDEAGQTSKATQRGMMGVLDRDSIRAVSPDARFACASNRIEDRAGAEAVISPILNRVTHYDLGAKNAKGEWSFDAPAWVSWALQHGLRPEVAAFIKQHPDYLYKFDAAARACPTLRSWESVSDLLDTTPNSLRLPTFAGTVGEAAAGLFVDHLRVSDRMPDLDFIFQNPEKATVPGEIDVLYAVICGMVSRVVGQHDLARQAFAYGKRLPMEYDAFLGREVYDAASQSGSVSTRMPEYQEWLLRHEKTLYAAVKGT